MQHLRFRLFLYVDFCFRFSSLTTCIGWNGAMSMNKRFLNYATRLSASECIHIHPAIRMNSAYFVLSLKDEKPSKIFAFDMQNL